MQEYSLEQKKIKTPYHISSLFLYPGQVGGAEWFLRNLTKGLELAGHSENYALHINSHTPKEDFKRFKVVENKVFLNRSLNDLIAPLLNFQAKGCKVLINTNYITSLFGNFKKVTVIHDIQFKSYPNYFSSKKRFWLDFAIKNTLKNSNVVVAISEFVKNDLIEKYGAKYQDKIKVVYNPIDESRFNTKPSFSESPKETYLMAIAAQYPHKNLERLFKAIIRLNNEGQTVKLKVAGNLGKNLRGGDYREYSEKLIKLANQTKNIEVLGYLETDQLDQFLKNSKAFIHPSLFEGFGMPVAEALLCGKPVICSNIPVLKEITEEQALFFDPYSEASIANAISSFLKNENPFDLNMIAEKLKEKYKRKKIAEDYHKIIAEL